MAYSDRIAAWQTFQVAHRAQNAALTTQIATLTSVMAGVAVNTISAQNITDINAAITAASTATTTLATAVTTAAPSFVKPD